MVPFRICISIALTILLCGCSSKKETKPNNPPQPVVTTPVTTKDVPIYVTAFGNIYAPLYVEIRPQITGKLTTAHVAQGAFVEKDQLLFSIDPRPFQAALDQAKATLLKDKAAVQIAQSTLQRNQELVKKDYIAQLTFETYESNLASAEAQVLADQAAVEVAEINLEYCSLVAPMDGRMSQYTVDPGNNVSPTDTNPITTVRQVDPIDVNFSIAQSDFIKVKQAQLKNPLKVYLTVPGAVGEDKIEGTIYFIDNNIDLATGTILIKATIHNDKRILWPGEYVNVNILLETRKDAVVIPYRALQIGQKGEFVYVIDNTNTTEVRNVVIGPRYEDTIIITQGLKPNEKVVTNGQINLRNGTKVVEKEPNQPDAKSPQIKQKGTK
jgi:multidrug efflux system membrane fusion protein